MQEMLKYTFNLKKQQTLTQLYFEHTSKANNNVLNVWGPQGTCISPALLTNYNDGCRSGSNNVEITKFADDTAIQGLMCGMSDVIAYCREVDLFCDWCKRHFLQLNVSKTKELVTDFRKKKEIHECITIEGEEVEQVGSYKYLGVHVTIKLDWAHHATSVITK